MDTQNLEQIAAGAADFIVNKMHKGQAFSIKTIDSWIQSEYSHLGAKGTQLLTDFATIRLVNDGRLVRKDRNYAPGVRKGFVLA